LGGLLSEATAVAESVEATDNGGRETTMALLLEEVLIKQQNELSVVQPLPGFRAHLWHFALCSVHLVKLYSSSFPRGMNSPHDAHSMLFAVKLFACESFTSLIFLSAVATRLLGLFSHPQQEQNT
jgi:hypothetical protein